MPEGTPTVENQLIGVVNTAIAELMNARDTASRQAFNRSVFDACVADAQTAIDSLEGIQ